MIHGDEFNEERLEDTQDGSTSDQLTVPNSNNTDSGVEVRELLIEYFSKNPL
jgi:hypothetical protein